MYAECHIPARMVATGWSSEWPGLWSLERQPIYDYWMCHSIGDCSKDQLRLSVINTQCCRKQCHSLTHISRSPFLFLQSTALALSHCCAATPWSLRKAEAGTTQLCSCCLWRRRRCAASGSHPAVPHAWDFPPTRPNSTYQHRGQRSAGRRMGQGCAGGEVAPVRGGWCWRGRPRWL